MGHSEEKMPILINEEVGLRAETLSMSHSDILEKAFQDLLELAETKGMSDELRQARERYSVFLLSFWQDKIDVWQERGGRVGKSVMLSPQEEVLVRRLRSNSGRRGDRAQVVILLDRTDPWHYDQFRLAFESSDRHHSLPFVRECSLKCSVKKDPNRVDYKKVFEVEMNGGQITRMKRAVSCGEETVEMNRIWVAREIDLTML